MFKKKSYRSVSKVKIVTCCKRKDKVETSNNGNAGNVGRYAILSRRVRQGILGKHQKMRWMNLWELSEGAFWKRGKDSLLVPQASVAAR